MPPLFSCPACPFPAISPPCLQGNPVTIEHVDPYAKDPKSAVLSEEMRVLFVKEKECMAFIKDSEKVSSGLERCTHQFTGQRWPIKQGSHFPIEEDTAMADPVQLSPSMYPV